MILWFFEGFKKVSHFEVKVCLLGGFETQQASVKCPENHRACPPGMMDKPAVPGLSTFQAAPGQSSPGSASSQYRWIHFLPLEVVRWDHCHCKKGPRLQGA